jgi:hypothetical protein
LLKASKSNAVTERFTSDCAFGGGGPPVAGTSSRSDAMA